MWGIFKRRKEKQEPANSLWMKAGAAIEQKQRKWATWLGEKAKLWSRNTLLAALVIFCVLQGGICIYILTGVFRDIPAQHKFERIIIPVNVIQQNNQRSSNGIAVTPGEYQRFKAFRLYMDSLRNNPDGKKIYDSILLARPGLPDSAALLESIYEQQLKK